MQQLAAVVGAVGGAGNAPLVQIGVGDAAPAGGGIGSACQRGLQPLQDQGVVHALDPQKPLFAGLGFAGFLAGYGGNVGLQDVLRPDKSRDKMANFKPRGVGVGQNDQPLRGGYFFEQILQRGVLKNAEAVGRQHRAVHKVVQPGGVVFALHQKGAGQFQHGILRVKASSHSAFCSKRSLPSLLLFRSISSLRSTRRHCSSWAVL